MKLRNKKTGEIGYIEYVMRTINPITGEPLLTVRYKDDTGTNCYIDYETVAEFNEEWEDYIPKEPIIKDDKIRKAIRAWAEVNKIEDNEKVEYKGIYWKLYYSTVGSATIQFNVPLRVADGSYTITELCGEEEE